jgi:hypothetical protein
LSQIYTCPLLAQWAALVGFRYTLILEDVLARSLKGEAGSASTRTLLVMGELFLCQKAKDI